MSLAVAEQEVAAPRKKRAQIKLDYATAGDAEDMVRLMKDAGFDIMPGLDWTDVYPFWLVAKIDERIVGCIQIVPTKPYGYLEFLSAESGLDHQIRARVLKKLAEQALAYLQLYGTQVAAFMVPFELKGYKRILRRKGAVTVQSGNMLALRTGA